MRMSRFELQVNIDARAQIIVFLLAAISSLMIGCVPVTQMADGRRIRATSDEFREYAATVFRRQNAASVALMDVLDTVETTDPSLAQQILDADAALQSACADLNAAAIARRDDQKIDRSALRHLVETIPLCDVATANAEALLLAAATSRVIRKTTPAPGQEFL